MKILNKILLSALIVLFSIGIAVEVVPEIQSSYTVQAASIKINKTKKTMKIGEKYTLKVRGTKKKVKWSSSKKSVATVSSKGKVTAKKVGTATITAKVANKKLKCKITVVATTSAKNIKVKYKTTPTSVIAIFTNNNSVAVSFKPKMVFYGSNGNIQSTDIERNYCFEPNSTIAMEFRSYNTSTYRSQEYSSYKLNMGSVTKSYYSTYGSKKIKISASRTDGQIIAEVTNNSGKKLDTIQLAIVYYDEDGNTIGYDYHDAECNVSGDVDYVNFNYPYDEDYNYIVPDSYEIYVNHAYKY